MNPSIKERRKFSFADKIITPSTIRKLAGILKNEAESYNEINQAFLYYSIDASDDSSYESGDIVIFNDGLLMDSKKLIKVVMRFQTLIGDKNIEIQLTHTEDEESTSNYIIISGTNTTWVNGIITRLVEIINQSEKQPAVRRYFHNLCIPLFILMNILFYRIISPLFIDKGKNDWVNLILLFAPICFVGLSFKYFNNYINEAWPVVELQTGRNYQQLSLIKRRKLIGIINLILIPLLLSLVYDLLKNIFHLF
jgi:hypothetical protein